MVISRLVIEFLIMIAAAFGAVATAAFGLATFRHTLVLDKMQNKIQDDNDEFARKVKKNISHNLGTINWCVKEIKLLKREIRQQKGEPLTNSDDETIDSYFESNNFPDHTNWNE